MPLSSADREAIIRAVFTSQLTFAELGRKHGVSREYIRQLAQEAGTTGKELRDERREDALSAEAELLVEDREYYIPPRWSERTYTRVQFETFLGLNDAGLLIRWQAAQALPLSRSGHATPNNQRCPDCEVWKEWDDFYSDTSRVYGRSSRCRLCAKDQAKAAYAAREEGVST